MNHSLGDVLSIIYNEGQWRINKVSPLFDLQYNVVKLKQYASKIRQSLVASLATNASIKYTVQFDEQPFLKYCEEDPSALVITVSSAHENSATNKVAYVAILLSWGMSFTLDSATHLPYLIERGEQKVGNAVKSTLQTIFDCNISQYVITQNQLLQFCFKFIDCDTSRSSDNFTLVYYTPQIDHKDQLNLTFQIGDVHVIWNGVKHYNKNRSDLVNIAYQMLYNQIFHMVDLDVKLLDLCKVILPKAEMQNNGTFKMKTPEAVNIMFVVLNEITFNTANDTSHMT
ncbi:uncharacterized protein LOC113521920 [Galleria mellonella]|uniref:Centromere protein L n=1 Tax=Galleria mellonella TaxID=7137 RepID=A0ABM3MWP6_GALME|nr:uncharacterized protein LOC113521920 [Galleria mellonella]XP_052755773.1 uncharacterized protein LOC113521920 [Galleria mellonella]